VTLLCLFLSYLRKRHKSLFHAQQSLSSQQSRPGTTVTSLHNSLFVAQQSLCCTTVSLFLSLSTPFFQPRKTSSDAKRSTGKKIYARMDKTCNVWFWQGQAFGYSHTNIYTKINTHRLAYIHIDTHTYTYTHIHTHRHTYIHLDASVKIKKKCVIVLQCVCA